MKKKIISALLSVIIVLSAFIIVPVTREISVEAAFDPSQSMYGHLPNVICGDEITTTGPSGVTASYDSVEKATKITTTTTTGDPFVYVGLDGFGYKPNEYPYICLVYKVPAGQPTRGFELFWFFSDNSFLNWSDPDRPQGSQYKTDGQYHAVVINQGALLSSKGSQLVTILRFDIFCGSMANANETVYLDSVACFTNWDDAYYYGQEREAVRNRSTETFTIEPNQFVTNNAFSDAHNVKIDYDSTENAFALTTVNSCPTINSGNGAFADNCSSSGGKYRCWYASANGLNQPEYQTVLDPQVYLNCNVDTSKYKYAVISFMLPFEADAGVLAGAGLAYGATAIFDSRYSEVGKNYASIVPQFKSGTAASFGVTSQYNFDQEGYYYTQIIDLTPARGEAITAFRIDPVEYTFSKLGITLYLKGITFATNPETAIASAESMLSGMTQYATYQQSVDYFANPLPNTTVSNIPSSETLVKFVSCKNITSWSYDISSAVPTANGVKFDGWAATPDGAVILQPGQTYTVSGALGRVAKPMLYAKWHYLYGSLNVTASNNSQNIDQHQSYLFRISGTGFDPSVGEFNMVVPLKTGETISLDLPVGTYTVTCIDVWSWRYITNSKIQTVTISAEGQIATATFEFSSKNESWLNDYDDSIIS